MQEYYIRDPETEESRGPFNVEQLHSLAENGHVTLETLIYDTEAESWDILQNKEDLRAAVFPERKRLMVKPKKEFVSLNVTEKELPPITVDSLLAAAEGNTEETRHKKKDTVWREKAAVVGMYIAAVSLLLSGVALLWLQRGLFLDFDVMALVLAPLVILGLLDLGVSFILFLQSSAVYPFIRFRTMLGAGFLLFFFWAAEVPLLGLAAAAGAFGVYGLTLFLKMAPFLISAVLALGGMGALLVLALGL